MLNSSYRSSKSTPTKAASDVLSSLTCSIGYLSSFLPPPPPPSGPSRLPPLLPTALELQPPTLESLNALLLAPHTCTASSISSTGPSSTGPHGAPLSVLLEAVLGAVQAGAPVLLPLPATGVAWALLEAVSAALERAGCAHVPLVLAGPVARDSLALANTSMDFVSRYRLGSHLLCTVTECLWLHLT